MMSKKALYLSCTASAFAMLVPGAWAQTVGDTARSTTVTPQDQGISDIIVTATRRSTNLQDTPIAVSAVDESLIERASPRNLGDLAIYIPNFSAASIQCCNAASFSMRGVGQNSILTLGEAPVSVLVDDFVYPSIQTQLLDTFDIAQIEVLRGPQGTLFGKNTTGGAITVRTKRPELDAFSGEVRAAYGSFGTKKAQASVNVPIMSGRLALRLVGSYVKSDGYMRNGACGGPLIGPVTTSKFYGRSICGDGKRLNGDDVFNGRAKLLWEPSDNFSTLLQYEILRDRSDGSLIVNETPNDPFFLFARIGLVGSTAGDPLDRGGESGRPGFAVEIDKGHRVDADGYYSNTDWKVGVGTLTNVLGYRKQRAILGSSYGGAPGITAADGEIFSAFDGIRDNIRKTLQEELRFASDLGGPFDFVAGGFYQWDSVDHCSTQIQGYQDLLRTPTPFGLWNVTPFTVCATQRTHAKAAFAEATYRFTDSLILTVGGRYTSEHKKFRARQQVFYQQLTGVATPDSTLTSATISAVEAADFKRFPAGVITSERTWNTPTWRASLSYRANEAIFVYGTYSRGFKAGGYNEQIGSGAQFGTNLAAFERAADPTNPEKADSFELGIKTDTWDRRLRFNLTAFLVKYSDLQKTLSSSIVVNGSTYQINNLVNAAKAEVKGLEAELTLRPIEPFTLTANASYQDGKYKSYVTPLPAGYDLSSAPMERTPKWQWNVEGVYTVPLGDTGNVAFALNASYTSRNLFDQNLSRAAFNTYLDARTLVNGSITFTGPDERYSLRLVGRNLFDVRYLTSGRVAGSLFKSVTYGVPRYLGVEGAFKF